MYPFSKGDLSQSLEARLRKTRDEISALDNEYVLNSSKTELVAHFVDKAKVDPVIIEAGQLYIRGRENTRIEVFDQIQQMMHGDGRVFVPGTKLEVAVPFSGDSAFFSQRPSQFSLSGYPEMEIYDGYITVTISFQDGTGTPESIRREIDQDVQSVARAVGHLKGQADAYNASLEREITVAVDRKHAHALSSMNIVESIGIPIMKVSPPPALVTPKKRRQIPAPPKSGKGPFSPEPALSPEVYEEILQITRSMALVIERSPSQFKNINEESIRTHFLIHLNGRFQGSATGETFNAAGKTDILIREGDKNIFIAECKFWKGKKSFSAALDQLLGYLSWRDGKAALLVFNKKQDTSAVQDTIRAEVRSRSEFRKVIREDPDTDDQYVLVKPDDPGREITLTIQIFDIPT
jgi:hypothetical protein